MDGNMGKKRVKKKNIEVVQKERDRGIIMVRGEVKG